jgi:hypothetical protein
LVESCLFFEEESDDIIGDKIFIDLEDFDFVVYAKSNDSETIGIGSVFDDIEDVAFMHLGGKFKGMVIVDSSLSGIPEADAAFMIANKQILIDYTQAIGTFIHGGIDDLEFLIESIDLDEAFCPLALLGFVVCAYELVLVEDCKLLYLYYMIAIAEV